MINLGLKKFNISLDKEVSGEKHKSLLRRNSSIPLSGTFYFLPIAFIIFLNTDTRIIIFCSLLFCLGLSADLKIITSYKLRLVLQFIFLSGLFAFSKDIVIDTRISLLNDLMNYDLIRILLCTFFFMVLVNGFNLIDGTNCLCSLNFLIIMIFIFLLIDKLNINYMNNEIVIFDDSKTHWAENNSDEDRIILIIDIPRPYYVKPGNSDVEQTGELKELIKKYM